MDYKITIQALDYIANKYHSNNKTNKMAALKLLFFAERYHIRKYAMMITDDTIYAMPRGPVSSAAKDILSFNEPDDKHYTNIILEEEGKHFYKSKKEIKNQEEYELLAETNIEALDFSINSFGHLSEWELVDETHKYPEWLRYEKSFKDEITRRENIVDEDFFSELISKNDPYKVISQETVNLAKEIYINGF